MERLFRCIQLWKTNQILLQITMIHQIYHFEVKEVKDWLRFFKKSLTDVTQCGRGFHRKVKDYYVFFTLKHIDTYTHT